MTVRLELGDIQGTVLRNRPMPYFGAYLVFRIDDAEPARTLIRRLIPHITSAADWEHPAENAWMNVVFSCEGLRRARSISLGRVSARIPAGHGSAQGSSWRHWGQRPFALGFAAWRHGLSRWHICYGR